MALTPTSIGNNADIPGSVASSYIPDQLIAGDLDLVTDNATITGAATLGRGAVLGRVTATGAFKLATSAAVDGSQTPAAILAATADASAGDVIAPVYLMGEFNGNALTLGSGITLAAAKLALRSLSIFIKTSVSAADPS